MALGKGIPVINGFDLNSKLPLDSRTVADTMENMNKLVTDGSVGDGQLCYCKADKKLYVLKDNVWSEVGGGGDSIPVVEGTIDESSSETEVIINIPQAQTKPFILHIEAMESYILMSVIMGAYLGYLYEGRNEKVAYIFQGADTTIDVSITNPIVPIVNATNTDDPDRYTIHESQTLAFILHIMDSSGEHNIFMSATNDGTFYYYCGIEDITSGNITYLYGSGSTIQRNTIKISGGGGGGSGDSIPILDITLDEANPKPLTDAQVNLLQANDGKLVIININFKADGTSLQATPTLAYILTSGPIIEFGGFKALICAGYFPYFNSINNFAWSNTYIYVNNDNTFSFVSNGFKIPNETEAGKVLMVSDSTYQGGAGKMIWSYEFKTISLFGKYSILVPYYNNSTDTNILPLPADASTSTYVLKAVNGVIKWVKES